jgi:DNA-binding winged helix-turn-helix (wHTH) protein
MNGNTRLEGGPPIVLARETDFALGAVTVRPSASEVVIGQTARRIEPRVMQTLIALVRAEGTVVSRDELMARCWSGLVVGEDAVTRAVGQLRRLAKAAPGSFAVETIPKIGYRLIGAAAIAAPALTGVAREAAPARASRLPASIALAAVIGTIVIAGAFAVSFTSPPIEETAEPRDALGTASAEARDRHARATALLAAGGRDNALRAEQLLREALELDPSFHAAKEALAIALRLAATFVPQRSGDAHAEIDELLDGEVVETPVVWRGHVMRGFQYGFAGDWLGAERALALARTTAPASAAGPLSALETFVLASVGRLEESLELVASQAKTQRLSLDHSRGLQQWLDRTGRHAEAEAEYARSRDLVGDRSAIELTALVRALGARDARTVAERLERYRATDWGRAGDHALSAVLGDRSASLALLRRQVEGFRAADAMPPFLAAAWAAYYGDDVLVVQALRAHPESLFANPGLLWDPVFARTRRSDAFKTLMLDFGYVEYWRSQGTWGDFCSPKDTDDFACH